MKIAVFSDIHGNIEALKAVLEQIKDKKVELTVFLGDIFQRGNEEIECLELLKNSEVMCLKGNCELYMEHGVDIDPDVEYLRGYYDKTRKNLEVNKCSSLNRCHCFMKMNFMDIKYIFRISCLQILICHILFYNCRT